MISKSGHYIPDVWETFKRASDHSHAFRVTGYIKCEKRKPLNPDSWIDQILMEDPSYDPEALNYIHCSREEAEFVMGSGVCGCVVSLDELILTTSNYTPTDTDLQEARGKVERHLGMSVNLSPAGRRRLKP